MAPPFFPDTEITELQHALKSLPVGNDDVQIVMGTSSAGPTLTLAPYAQMDDLVADFGYGPGPEAGALSLDESDGTPLYFLRLPSSTPGALGTIDISGVTGTCVPAASGTPYDSYEVYFTFPTGGTLGTEGITFYVSLDDGRTLSPLLSLGTAYSYTIPNSGITLNFNPPAAQVTAFIAAAVEARADTLAHLADVTAHDAADTSAEQVALAASSAPTTEAEAWAVLNLCRLALAAHESNITVHNGPDDVNVVTHAAATSGQTGIDLYVDYKAKFNLHLAATRAASAAGLLAATATLLTTAQTFTAADCIAGGITALNAYPCRLRFTTAGGTASDAPSAVTITGTVSGVAQTETLNLAQTATSVVTTKAWDGTGLSWTYAADGGTGATIAVGYEQAVHNSADVTNTLSSTTPTHGTIVADDVILLPTTEPKPATQDITDAFTAIANGQQTFGFVQVVGALSAAQAAAVANGIDLLRTRKKFRGAAAIIGTRLPTSGEATATWRTSIKTDFASWVRADVMICAGWWWQTSAISSRKYLRSIAPAVAARSVTAPIYVDLAKTSDGAMDMGTLYDEHGNLIGYDEAQTGGLGLDQPGFCTLRTFSTKGTSAFISNPRLHTDPENDFQLWQQRRVMNVLESVIYDFSVSFDLSAEGAADENGFVEETIAKDIEGDIRDAIKAALPNAISNPNDPDIFRLSRTDPVLTNGGELNASSRIRGLFYIKKLKVTTAFKR